MLRVFVAAVRGGDYLCEKRRKMQSDGVVFRLACRSGLSVREIFMAIYGDPYGAQDEFTAYLADDALPQQVVDYCTVRLARLPGATSWSAAGSDTDHRDRGAERAT
jgi:hypothetical protein